MTRHQRSSFFIIMRLGNIISSTEQQSLSAFVRPLYRVRSASKKAAIAGSLQRATGEAERKPQQLAQVQPDKLAPQPCDFLEVTQKAGGGATAYIARGTAHYRVAGGFS
jgi:hypothetical protein